MATKTLIDTYEVFYSANKFIPRIWLYNKGKPIGNLYFHPNGSTLPEDTMSVGQAMLFYHLEDFKNIIDLLRNEKPMYLFYAGSGPGFENAIMTDPELVGEGEK
jgi:hypothetical protein